MTSDLSAPSGIDLSFRDQDVRVQDDLFAHVNGQWLAGYEIPADRAVDGAFRTLYDQAELDVQAIITDSAAGAADDADARKIGDLFSSFMATDVVAAAGFTPVAEELRAIAEVGDPSAFAALLGRLQRTGVRGALAYYVDTDDKNSTRYLVHATQSGIGLPDESYYRADEFADIRDAYLAHITKTFTIAAADASLAGLLPADPADAARRVFDLERTLAAGHWDVVRRRDAEKSYNLTTFADLVAENPEFDWAAWVDGVATGLDRDGKDLFAELVVRQPGYLRAFATAWAEVPQADWQAWAAWQVLHARSGF
ncbi:peptidase M13, partial [Nocardia sp. NPDC060220]